MIMHHLKFKKRLYWAKFLAQTFAERIHVDPPCALIPVPTTRQSFKKRGFNPALELALVLGQCWQVPVIENVFICQEKRVNQAKLNKHQRKANIRHAFASVGHLPPLKRVGIVDDVLTTGATINALSQLIRQQTEARIQAFVMARSILNHPKMS